LESLTESTYSLVLYTIPVKERCRWAMESKSRRTEHHPHEFPNGKSFKVSTRNTEWTIAITVFIVVGQNDFVQCY